MANDLDRIRRLAVDGIDTANHEYGTGELRELAELAVSLCSEVERLRALVITAYDQKLTFKQIEELIK